eukprot:SAG22_NODE_723_length_7636_cov_75.271726_7_plen_99_part_00
MAARVGLLGPVQVGPDPLAELAPHPREPDLPKDRQTDRQTTKKGTVLDSTILVQARGEDSAVHTFSSSVSPPLRSGEEQSGRCSRQVMTGSASIRQQL